MQSDIIRQRIEAREGVSKAAQGFSVLSAQICAQLNTGFAELGAPLNFKPKNYLIQQFNEFCTAVDKRACYYMADKALIMFSGGVIDYCVDARLGGADETQNTTVDSGSIERALYDLDLQLCSPIASTVLQILKRTLLNAGEIVDEGFEQISSCGLDLEASHVFKKDQSISVFNFMSESINSEISVICELNQVEVSFERDSKEEMSPPGQSRYWKEHMNSVMHEIAVPLDTIIETTDVLIDNLSHLKEGDTFLIDRKSLENIDVILRAPSGVIPVARGALGAMRRHKAIRLTESVNGSVAQDIKTFLNENRTQS